jgi:Bacterial PH domain
MREFRPPVKPSALRPVLAVVLGLVSLVPVAVLGSLALGTSAISYTIGGGALVVTPGDLFSAPRTVQLADVTEARRVTLRGGRRTSGTALPGHCTGRFTYPELGAVWQATDCTAGGVLVRASGADRPIVVTPPDPEAFLAALRAGTETAITLPPPDPSMRIGIAAIMIPTFLVLAVMLGALILRGPSRMRYLVGDGALEVHTIFGKKRWATAGARAKEYRPRGFLRVAGAALPGYHTGIFRESGQSTRLYATDPTRVILFEGPARVMLSPEDRGGFLEALRAEGVEIERLHAGDA